VAFKYTSSPSDRGRAVTMSADFDDIRVEHQELILSAKARLPGCENAGGPANPAL
jgi:hypothetical protein